MAALLLDGRAAARACGERLAPRIAALKQRGVQPTLVVVMVGENPASKVYVRSKRRACEEAGIRSIERHFGAESSPAQLYAGIRALNAESAVHGILVQLPLPPHLDALSVAAMIAPGKDVDGFHPLNQGALLRGSSGFPPCTPSGVMCLLDAARVPVAGRHAVIIGRSNIVGKPMGLMLLQRHATVTVCNSKTPSLEEHTRQADILVAAAGWPRLVGADMVKPGAAVIDVGIHRGADGGLVGDVDFGPVSEVAGWITPVPGGVGPMTVAMLLDNAVRAAEHADPQGDAIPQSLPEPVHV
jgi:methylenetetrahydrofolate dehydrogenase (NADP+) / methenyltetrahydrofolate cyclohydrolase